MPSQKLSLLKAAISFAGKFKYSSKGVASGFC